MRHLAWVKVRYFLKKRDGSDLLQPLILPAIQKKRFSFLILNSHIFVCRINNIVIGFYFIGETNASHFIIKYISLAYGYVRHYSARAHIESIFKRHGIDRCRFAGNFSIWFITILFGKLDL